MYLLDRGQFGRVPGLLSSADPRSLQLGRILKAIKTGVNELVVATVAVATELVNS